MVTSLRQFVYVIFKIISHAIFFITTQLKIMMSSEAREAREAVATGAAAEPSADDRCEEKEDGAATPAAAVRSVRSVRSSGAPPSGAPAPKRARSQSSDSSESSSSSALTCRERVARLEQECGLLGLLGLHHRLLVSRIVSLEESLEIVPLAACGIVRRICALEEYISHGRE